MTHALLMDLGNVLLHFSHERMCRQVAGVCGLPEPEVRRLFFESGLERRFERGELAAAQVHAILEEAAGRKIDARALLRAASDIFWPNEPMLPIVAALRAAGYRMVLVSNTNEAHLAVVRDRFPEALAAFHRLVCSHQVGAMKPEEAIFAAAVEAAGCPPGECFFTDDVPAYVEAARTFGIDAETYIDAETFVGHLRRRGIAIAPRPLSPEGRADSRVDSQ